MQSPLSRMSNLGQRVVAGIIGGALMVGGICFSEWTYFLLFGAILFFAQKEFYKLSIGDGHAPLTNLGSIIGLLIFAFTFFNQKDLIPSQWLVLLPVLLGLVFLTKLYRIENKPFTNVAYTFLGIIYVAVPFSMMNVAAFSQGNGYSFHVVMGTMLLLWSSDSGAYFAGSKLGKTRLFERISPKKSWEGFAGGMALALAVAYVLSLFFTDLVLWKWLVIACIMVCVGTYGDLVESMLKRSIAIKDSGDIIPGHGGFLDRFDGLLLAAPVVAAFLVLVK